MNSKIKYQLAWVMYDGSYDEINELFDTYQELVDFVSDVYPIIGYHEYVWREIEVKDD